MRSLENKTVLVTGASGFIGSHLADSLSKINGIRLLLLSRQSRTSDLPHVQWLQETLGGLSKEYWQQHGISCIDVVFHLGAFTPKTSSEANDVERVFVDNLTGTRTLLEGLPPGVERIVFSSTLDVYAPTIEGEVLTEASRVEPPGLYGVSKLFCERLVAVWAAQHNCQYAILRYGHIFGPGEEAYGKLIPLTIRQLLTGNAPSVYGAGRAERDFLYVADAVEATIRAAKADGSIGPVNIVRGKSYPIRDIVKMLIEKSGAMVGINFLTDKPDGHSLRFDNTRMSGELGEWPLVSLTDGLAEEVKAFRRLIDE